MWPGSGAASQSLSTYSTYCLPTVYLLSTYCLPAVYLLSTYCPRRGEAAGRHELTLNLLCTYSVPTLYSLWRRRGVLVRRAGAACWPEPLGG